MKKYNVEIKQMEDGVEKVFNEYHEYDDKYNLTYVKSNKSGKETEHWYYYDENNNKIYLKNSYGFESWTKYDENNNPIYNKTNKGTERWTEYDDKNRVIKYENSNGSIGLYAYKDLEDGYVEYTDIINDCTITTRYDKFGNVIYAKRKNSKQPSIYKYNDNNKLMYFSDKFTGECHIERDEYDRVISTKSSSGYYETITYTEIQ